MLRLTSRRFHGDAIRLAHDEQESLSELEIDAEWRLVNGWELVAIEIMEDMERSEALPTAGLCGLSENSRSSGKETDLIATGRETLRKTGTSANDPEPSGKSVPLLLAEGR